MVRRFKIAQMLVPSIAICLELAAEALPKRSSRPAQQEEITPELRLAVNRGFEYLTRRQLRSGDFDSDHPLAVNALVGIAFLASGHSEKAGGEFTEVIRRGTSALLRYQNSQGFFDDERSAMYGHGFATLFLAELYGTSEYRHREIREALLKAVRVIEGSQSRSGGWDYLPARQFGSFEASSGSSDTSITVCQTMALRAARNLGIGVNTRVTARARAYIERAQNKDGGFLYRQQGELSSFLFNSSAFPRSAAGTCILYSLGDYNSAKVRLGFEYLYKNYRMPWSNQFPYYAHYYCAQAMFQAGGKYWKEYFPWIRSELLGKQLRDGSWPNSLRENKTQCTAMALIVLQLPLRFLPIHER